MAAMDEWCRMGQQSLSVLPTVPGTVQQPDVMNLQVGLINSLLCNNNNNNEGKILEDSKFQVLQIQLNISHLLTHS